MSDQKGPSTRGTFTETTRVKIYEDQVPAFNEELNGPLELGRQDPSRKEPEPYQCVWNSATNRHRLIVARYDETSVSRQHAMVEPIGPKLAKVTALRSEVCLEHGEVLAPGESRQIKLPHLLLLGIRPVRLESLGTGDSGSGGSDLQSLAVPTIAPGQRPSEPSLLKQVLSDRSSPIQYDTFTNCLRDTIEVFQQVVSSPDFLPDAARTVLEVIQVDVAAVLMKNGTDWEKVAVSARHDEDVDGWQPSRSMLAEMVAQKSTMRFVPAEAEMVEAMSLVDVRALVAAPLLNTAGEVVGAIYGDRRRPVDGSQTPQISEVEANLVELISCGVSAGLARLEKETEATAARVKFEQFVTPEVARQLESDRDLLTGRDAHISVMFCDIRGFSAISERIGPRTTMEWIGDVLGDWSACTLENGGVLVDYIGDEMLAMWGAPLATTDHANRACQAAADILDRLPEVSRRWQKTLGAPTVVAIGINSGTAHVGNTGSAYKFKYGPLGNTVNLASRVQRVTRQVKSSPLLTQFTVDALHAPLPLRRLCSVQVVNIQEPVNLYQLIIAEEEADRSLRTAYEEALLDFENGSFRRAARILGALLNDYPEDGPTLVLMARVVRAMAEGTPPSHPVWVLSEK